jgi:L-fuculose-phosphate aldolase
MEGGPEAWITVERVFAEAMDGLEPGGEAEIVTWLHQGDRSTLRVHPRGDVSRPIRGVFSTRSPDRPNPLGSHRVQILDREGTRLRVRPLEVLDGTPVVDIKNVTRWDFGQDAAAGTGVAGADHPDAQAADGKAPEAEPWGANIPAEVGEAIQTTCVRAWERGLMPGFSGNVSVRMGNVVVITASGAAKGYLTPGDLTALDLASGRRLEPGRPSTESAMHLEIYDRQPEAWAVVHTHPPRLLALSLCVAEADLLDLPLFEADVLQKSFAQVPAHQPGTPVLAKAVATAAATCKAVFMRRHGLVCWGASLTEALALSEEVEFLAGVQLSTLAPGPLGTGRPLFSFGGDGGAED